MSKKIEVFKKELRSKDGIEIYKNIAEATIDSIMDEGFLQKLPVIGIGIAVVKLGKNINEALALKKLAAFLSNLEEVTNDERRVFYEKVDKDENARKEFFERILVQLEKLDEVEKAVIYSNIFKLYLLEIITKHEFLRYSKIIENAYLGDLLALNERYCQVKGLGQPSDDLLDLFYQEDVQASLQALGLLTFKSEEAYQAEIDSKPAYTVSRGIVTETGRKLAFVMYYNNEYLEKWKHDKIHGILKV